jgi:hypothetical protein
MSIAVFCRDKTINRKYFYYHCSQHLKRINPSVFIQANPPQEKITKDKSDYLIFCHGGRQLRLTADVSAVKALA